MQQVDRISAEGISGSTRVPDIHRGFALGKLRLNCRMKNRMMNTSLRSVQAVRRNKSFIVVIQFVKKIKRIYHEDNSS